MNYIFIFERISATITRLIHVYANNVVFTLEIKLCLYQIAIKYLLSPFLCYLFIHLRQISSVCLFYIIIINSSSFDNQTKTSAFKERFLCKNYPKLVKAYRNESNSLSNRLDMNQFLVLFHDCVPNVKQFWAFANF